MNAAGSIMRNPQKTFSQRLFEKNLKPIYDSGLRKLYFRSKIGEKEYELNNFRFEENNFVFDVKDIADGTVKKNRFGEVKEFTADVAKNIAAEAEILLQLKMERRKKQRRLGRIRKALALKGTRKHNA